MLLFVLAGFLLVRSVLLASLTCQKPLVYRCPSVTPKMCGTDKDLLLRTRCGCYCPRDDQYQTCDSDFNIKCVEDQKSCICPGGQKFTLCGLPYTRTCTRPALDQNPFDDTPPPCVPRCQCPDTKPIWHMGKCIKENDCICIDKCVTEGCDECRECSCRKGKPRNCADQGCPNMYVKPSVIKMEISGCWRMCPSREMCIFFYFCPDAYTANTCNPLTGPFVWPTSYCNRCVKCRCEKNHELCQGDPYKCGEQMWRERDKGCWTKVKGECRFTWPCPEIGDDSCACATPGTRSCKMCKKCECAYGKKFCSGPDKCPDPKHDGCVVRRRYDGVIDRCYYVSPCPTRVPALCPAINLAKIYTDSCYMFNEQLNRCEFVHPCPETTSCCDGDFTCKDCNECRCSKESIRCTKKKCGNPVPKGCWVHNEFISRCEFVSPCPANAVHDATAHCDIDPGKPFCVANDCNVCACSPKGNGLFKCGDMSCPKPMVKYGKWHASCSTKSCVFVHPDNIRQLTVADVGSVDAVGKK